MRPGKLTCVIEEGKKDSTGNKKKSIYPLGYVVISLLLKIKFHLGKRKGTTTY